MAIQMVERDNLSCPVVFCDYCNREITAAKDGNFEWKADFSSPAPMFFTHKLCSDAFRKTHQDIDSSLDLAELPGYLVANLGISS